MTFLSCFLFLKALYYDHKEQEIRRKEACLDLKYS